jgi:TadE-like protein
MRCADSCRPRPGTPAGRERGTATLEVVGMIPLVILLVFVLVQTAIALYGITTAQTAARQGARAFSQGDDPSTVVRQSVPSWMGASSETFGPGHGVRAIVDVPDLIPAFDLRITKQTVMP